MEPLLLIVLFIGLVIAAYQDLRIREVPDTLSYGLIVLGLLGSLAAAIINKDLAFFLEHLAGFGAGVAIGVLMFYTRQWGGGDAKLIMGVGAIIGLSFENFNFVIFLVLLIVLGALYGLLWTAALAVIHKKKFVEAYKKRVKSPNVHKVRITLTITAVVLLVAIIFVPFVLKLLLSMIIFFLYLITYSWIFIKTIEENIMVKLYPVSKLTEGDWVAENVIIGKKVLIKKKNTGITKAQIKALKKSKKKHVLVREGVPFVPSFLLAFIALLVLHRIFGDSLLSILLG